MSNRLTAAVAVFALCFAASLASQEKTGQDPHVPINKKGDYALIFVSVFDAKGLSAYGVPVKIRRAQEKKARWEGYSDRRGEFAQRLPVGKMDYIVWADLKDKAAAKKSEAKVTIESNERQDVGLHLN